MKKLFFLTISAIFIWVLPISIPAVEGMSLKEIEVRSEHERAKKRLFECYAFHKVDSKEMEESVCKDERTQMEYSRQIFNQFMRDKEASPSYKISREKFEEIERKYGALTEEKLRNLHIKSCQTKWGISDSRQCWALASQIRKKEIERLRSK